MMKAELYLKEQPDFDSRHKEIFDRGEYELASIITARVPVTEGEMLERVFSLANVPELYPDLWVGEDAMFHIEDLIPQHRSLSVGDVVVLQPGTSEAGAFFCKPAGWEKVEWN